MEIIYFQSSLSLSKCVDLLFVGVLLERGSAYVFLRRYPCLPREKRSAPYCFSDNTEEFRSFLYSSYMYDPRSQVVTFIPVGNACSRTMITWLESIVATDLYKFHPLMYQKQIFIFYEYILSLSARLAAVTIQPHISHSYRRTKVQL